MLAQSSKARSAGLSRLSCLPTGVAEAERTDSCCRRNVLASHDSQVAALCRPPQRMHKCAPLAQVGMPLTSLHSKEQPCAKLKLKHNRTPLRVPERPFSSAGTLRPESPLPLPLPLPPCPCLSPGGPCLHGQSVQPAPKGACWGAEAYAGHHVENHIHVGEGFLKSLVNLSGTGGRADIMTNLLRH